MNPWQLIDEFLSDKFNPCDYSTVAYGLVRQAVDGEGVVGRLIKESDPDLEELSFDFGADVQWFHMLGSQGSTPGDFGSNLTHRVELVWAEKVGVSAFSAHAIDDAFGLFYPQLSTSVGPFNARRWNLELKDLPNEYKFGVVTYSFNRLTNYA
ncbi:hypothetical protein [Siphonobacter sp. BAB-5385]|uniref:hypothetical protein n=1 Tax=Siphonobacter sp. BAB-5385 TaxID=1864822 RepID=UPI000B9EA619|nr:hypothetical protein [Siphonobacter sp. BAB-5385]